MKKLSACFLLLACIPFSKAAITFPDATKGNPKVTMPVKIAKDQLLKNFILLKSENIESLQLKKMNGMERIALRKIQKKLRNQINSEGIHQRANPANRRTGAFRYNKKAFLLGIFQGPVGFIKSIFAKSTVPGEKFNRIFWSFLGFVCWAAVAVVLIFVIFLIKSLITGSVFY